MNSQRFNQEPSVALVMSVLLCAGCTPTQPTKPAYLLQYSKILGPSVQPEGDYSVIFTSEDSIALLFGSGVCRLFVIEHHGREWEVVATAATCGSRNQVYAAPGRNVLVSLGDENVLYSPDLKKNWRIPIRVMETSSLRGSNTVAALENGHWTAYQLLPEYRQLRAGPGEMQSISDRLVVFRTGFVVHTQTIEGIERGSFRIKELHSREAEIIDDNRLFRSTESGDRIITFDGRKLALIPAPQGFGGWHGWSTDHRRILYDKYTRDVPFLQRATEVLLAIVTFGIGTVNEVPNGEVIRVLDISTRRVCFDLTSPKKLLGRAYGYHADISPSGRLVAVLNTTELSVFQVPACSNSEAR